MLYRDASRGGGLYLRDYFIFDETGGPHGDRIPRIIENSNGTVSCEGALIQFVNVGGRFSLNFTWSNGGMQFIPLNRDEETRTLNVLLECGVWKEMLDRIEQRFA